MTGELYEKQADGSLKPVTGPTYVNVLLDESGSMQSMKDEVLSGLAAYFNRLREDGQEYHVTLAKFDSTHYDEVCHEVPLAEVPQLTAETYRPGAMTPLYDSIARIVNDRKTGRAITVILTDGLENTSREWTLDRVNALIKEREGQGQTFVYLGVAPEAWANAKIFAGTFSFNNVVGSSGARAVMDSYMTAASATSTYSSTGAQSGILSDEDLARVREASDRPTPQ
jgi:hypothetical protein